MKGTIVSHPSFPSRLVDPRTIQVWLPPGYSPSKQYAVLYMHDGQMLFEGSPTWTGTNWQVDKTMALLISEKKIRESIVVSIPNQGMLRWAEYLPQKALDLMPTALREQIETRWLMDRPMSDAYLAFIVTELKPFIDTMYSTLADRDHTMIMGSSMGGVISLYAICEYPEVFGGAGCLSTHWPLDIPGLDPIPTDFDIPSAFLSYLRTNLPDPRHHRIYFDYGTATLDALYPPFQQQADVLMKARGYTSDHWITKEFPGEGHTETAWAARLHIPLMFLLGT